MGRFRDQNYMALSTEVVASLASCYSFYCSPPQSPPLCTDMWDIRPWPGQYLPHGMNFDDCAPPYSANLWKITLSASQDVIVAWHALSHIGALCSCRAKVFLFNIDQPPRLHSTLFKHQCSYTLSPCQLDILQLQSFFPRLTKISSSAPNTSQNMRYYFTSLLAVAFSAAVTSAQNLQDIPQCAMGPALDSIGSTHCDTNNFKCICNNKSWLTSLLPDIEKDCSPDDLKSTSPSLHFS